jgi:mRNA-degrading endonuclease RelE of RelBE toxin-antitoxin system
MGYNLILTDEADQDTADAYLYYEGQLEGLGDRFLHELQHLYDQLKDNPEHYGYFSKNQKYNYRRVAINHFPYLVIYRVINDFVVVQVIHNSNRDNTKFL